MKKNKHILFHIGSVDRLIKKFTGDVMTSSGIDDIAIIHGYIFHFLEKNEGKDVYQKDIEKEMKVAKSYVTGILKSFEERGWIKRESIKEDARLKKISLTESGRKVHQDIKKSFEHVDSSIENALTAEELDTFLDLLNKIENKVKGEINA